jgi:hypothetical protein
MSRLECSAPHRNLFPAHIMFPIHSNKLLENLHWHVALCVQKTNHTSHLFICPTLQSCCHFRLDVMCARADLVHSSHRSNKYSYPRQLLVGTTLPLVNIHQVLHLFVPYFWNKLHITYKTCVTVQLNKALTLSDSIHSQNKLRVSFPCYMNFHRYSLLQF